MRSINEQMEKNVMQTTQALREGEIHWIPRPGFRTGGRPMFAFEERRNTPLLLFEK